MLLFTACSYIPPSPEADFILQSKAVQDSFELYIDVPESFNPKLSYDLFVYLDANLHSGKQLRSYVQQSVLTKPSCNTIFVGVGHIGNYKVLRRRDFIVPQVFQDGTNNASQQFGQIEHFYQFLETEFLPAIQQRFKINRGNNAILGHSLGGHFAMYCLFKNDALFHQFYCLSPSLWVNNYAIYNYNQLPSTAKDTRQLFLSVGAWEWLNRIKPGADAFERFFKQQNYPYIQFAYKVYEGQTHQSQLAYSFRDIFE